MPELAEDAHRPHSHLYSSVSSSEDHKAQPGHLAGPDSRGF